MENIIDGISEALGFGEIEKYGLYGIIGGFILIFVMPVLSFVVFASTAIFFSIAGMAALFTESKEERYNYSPQWNLVGQIRPTTSAPMTDEPTIADKIKEIHAKNDFKCPSCGAVVLPTDVKCRHCGSILVAAINLPKPEKWGEVEIGQSIQITHPQLGVLRATVIHRMVYGELWQAQMKPDVPWTLTGNYYVRLGLEKELELMNWQNRFYLLESRSSLTDMDINRDFAQAARSFAASNQTRDVTFIYDKIVWKMEDIGRFRIEFAEGDGISVSPGAIGRFIHARRDNNILVVDDYQSGGAGLDTLWLGYQIEEVDIKF